MALWNWMLILETLSLYTWWIWLYETGGQTSRHCCCTPGGYCSMKLDDKSRDTVAVQLVDSGYGSMKLDVNSRDTVTVHLVDMALWNWMTNLETLSLYTWWIWLYETRWKISRHCRCTLGGYCSMKLDDKSRDTVAVLYTWWIWLYETGWKILRHCHATVQLVAMALWNWISVAR
jgi:hypothetical protein